MQLIIINIYKLYMFNFVILKTIQVGIHLVSTYMYHIAVYYFLLCRVFWDKWVSVQIHTYNDSQVLL